MDIIVKDMMEGKMPTTQLSIAKDFSEFPAGRESEDGPFSGERFRDEFLAPLLEKQSSNDVVEIDLDGTMGYGSSFLEEAFGGLVRKYRLPFDTLKKRLRLHDTRVIYERMVWQYIQQESKRVFKS